MLRFVISIGLYCWLVPALFAQGFVSLGMSIPDPNKKLQIAQFLANKTVVKAIGLNSEERAAIEQLLAENNGDLANVTFGGSGSKIPSFAELKAKSAKMRQENERRLDEILDPIQQDRLRQIVYQIEISRIGPAEALITGFLGKEVGVETYQKTAMRIVAESADVRAKRSILEIVSASRESVIAELSATQRSRIKDLFGSTFDFLDQMQTIKFEYREPGFAIPTPNSLMAVVGLAMNDSIAKEIGLSPEARSALEKLHKDSRRPKEAPGPLAEIGFRKDELSKTICLEIQNQVEELLTVKQKQRLQQLAYHVETSRIGLIAALLSGYLGKELGLDSQQKLALERANEEIQEKADANILRVLIAWREEIFRELTPLQREKATKLLGKDFRFREEYAWAKRLK
jgi:transcriptional regulator of met regulon